MTVKEMIESLSTLDPNAELVVSGFDHGFYRVLRVNLIDAELTDKGSLYEFAGEEYMEQGSRHVKVAMIV